MRESGFEELMKENGIVCERRREWKESKTIVARGILLIGVCWPLWERMTGWAFRCMRWEGREGEDYQFYVEVPGEEKDKLIIALMTKIYGAAIPALANLKFSCTRTTFHGSVT